MSGCRAYKSRILARRALMRLRSELSSIVTAETGEITSNKSMDSDAIVRAMSSLIL